MKVVAAWIEDPGDQALAKQQLARVADLRCFASEAALLASVANGGVAAALVNMSDRDGTAVVSSAAALRWHSPRLPVVLWCRPSRGALRNYQQALGTGARLAYADRDDGALERTVGAALVADWHPGPVAEHVERYASLLPSPLDLFVVACAIRPSWQLDLETAAGWIGMSDRTLRGRLHKAGLASPRIIHHYLLLLHAAWLLIEGGAVPKQVADALDFPSVNGLNDLFNTLTGMPAGAFRERGGLSDLRQRCENVVRGLESPYADERRLAPRGAARRDRRAPRPERPAYAAPTVEVSGPLSAALLAELGALFPGVAPDREPKRG